MGTGLTLELRVAESAVKVAVEEPLLEEQKEWTVGKARRKEEEEEVAEGYETAEIEKAVVAA